MKPLWLLVGGSLVLALPGAWALPRARRELRERGGISGPTFLAALIGYAGLGVVTLVAAWLGAWPLRVEARVAQLAGGAVAGLGAALYLAARAEFRSFRLTWGLETSRLITSGIYRWSRHPQSVGWTLVLAGLALIGRSGVALALAVFYCLTCLVWLPIEESVLEQRFGSSYRDYRARTSAILGFPGGR